VTVADYLSLVRIPLGVMFLVVADRVGLALGVLAAAGLSDVLDGWVARRQQREHQGQALAPAHPHRGEWLDPLCDKLFVLAVALGLYIARQPPLLLLGLLMTREVLQTISMVVMRLVPSLHRASSVYDYKAHPLGKATTVVQFLTGALLLLDHPLARPAVYLTAALGVVTVAIYISRVRRILPAAAPRTDR
jgi:cardiolipin synthase (CMP-forming)